MKKLILIPFCFSISASAISPEYIDEVIQKQLTQQEAVTKAPNKSYGKTITCDECAPYIATYIIKILADQGTSFEALPASIQKELSTACQCISVSLNRELQHRKSTTISTDVIHKIMYSALDRFFRDATLYVTRDNVQTTVESLIEKLLQTADVDPSKVNQRMQNEYAERKNKLIAKLVATMKNDNRDYVTLNEINTALHTSFDGFIMRMHFGIMWPIIEATTEQLKKEQAASKVFSYVPITPESLEVCHHLKQLRN